MAAATPLLRLPPELILRISNHLTTSELGYFRRTCKQIEHNLFNTFAREFFTKRQFMIEEPSLEALVGIANHKSLAPFLQEVIVSTDAFPANQANAWRPNYLPRDVLLATGRACAMLVEAFSHLPNLRIIGLRDYDGRGRERDGADALWRSYGWTLAVPDNAHLFDGRYAGCRSPLIRAEPDALLSLLLFALSEAHARPQNIEVFLRRTNLPDCAFYMTPQLLQDQITCVMSGIKTLLLSIDDLDSRHTPHGQPASERDLTDLKHFLQHTPLLEHLRLNFTSNTILVEQTSRLLKFLSDDIHLTGQPKIELNHLARLDLGMVAVEPATLLRLSAKYTSLSSLSLWKTSLYTRDPDAMKTLWPHFLPALGQAFKRPENMTSLAIGFAAVYTDVASGARHSAPVKFASKVSTNADGETVYERPHEDKVSYREHVGSNLREWLKQQGEAAHVPLLEAINHGMTSDESDVNDDSDADSEGMFLEEEDDLEDNESDAE